MRAEAEILSKVIYPSESKLILGQLVPLLPRDYSGRQEFANLLDMVGGFDSGMYQGWYLLSISAHYLSHLG